MSPCPPGFPSQDKTSIRFLYLLPNAIDFLAITFSRSLIPFDFQGNVIKKSGLNRAFPA
jgi:hypothetical protein